MRGGDGYRECSWGGGALVGLTSGFVTANIRGRLGFRGGSCGSGTELIAIGANIRGCPCTRLEGPLFNEARGPKGVGVRERPRLSARTLGSDELLKLEGNDSRG